jgi:phosphatidylinositol alpha-1,6-mannosyltransferase
VRLLVIAADLGVGPGGALRPGGVAAMGRTVASALARLPAVGRLSVWSLLDDPSALGPALAARDPAVAAAEVRGFRGSRLRLAAALARGAGRFEAGMFLHLGPARLARLLRGRPYSVWLHGIEAWGALTGSRRRALERAALRIAVSRETARRAVAANPWLSPPRVVHLGMGADATARDALPPSRRPRQALMVARMSRRERYKGHEVVFAAWPAVRARLPDARLVVVGGGDDADRLRGLAGPGIEMVGEVTDAALDSLHASSRLFLLPSTGEGFGLVYLDAMRHGTPCVASPGAPAEIVLDGVTGRVVPQDSGAVAQAALDLLGDDGLADRMGAAGRARVRQEFTFEAFGRRLAHVLSIAPAPTPVTEA